MSQKKGLVLVFFAALFLSIGGLCVKMIPWDGLSINAFRSLISACLIFLFAKVTHVELKVNPGVLIGAACVCGATTLYIVSTKLTTAANAVLLQFTTAPVFIILFLWVFFKDRPKRLDVVTCLFVFGGIACFFLDSLGGGSLLGNVLAVVSGVFYAGVFMMNKLPGGNAIFSCILGQSLGALIGLPSLVRETQFDGRTLLFACVLGVFQLGLSYILLSVGLRYAEPVSASLVTGIEPILNPVLVALVVGETISGLSLLGGGVVFVTIMTYNILSARKEKEAQKSAETDVIPT